MSTRNTTATTETRMRWYVRLEARPTKFGDSVHASLVWAVFPYLNRDRQGEPIPFGAATSFHNRTNAHHYARHVARMHYGFSR